MISRLFLLLALAATCRSLAQVDPEVQARLEREVMSRMSLRDIEHMVERDERVVNAPKSSILILPRKKAHGEGFDPSEEAFVIQRKNKRPKKAGTQRQGGLLERDMREDKGLKDPFALGSPFSFDKDAFPSLFSFNSPSSSLFESIAERVSDQLQRRRDQDTLFVALEEDEPEWRSAPKHTREDSPSKGKPYWKEEPVSKEEMVDENGCRMVVKKVMDEKDKSQKRPKSVVITKECEYPHVDGPDAKIPETDDLQIGSSRLRSHSTSNYNRGSPQSSSFSRSESGPTHDSDSDTRYYRDAPPADSDYAVTYSRDSPSNDATYRDSPKDATPYRDSKVPTYRDSSKDITSYRDSPSEPSTYESSRPEELNIDKDKSKDPLASDYIDRMLDSHFKDFPSFKNPITSFKGYQDRFKLQPPTGFKNIKPTVNVQTYEYSHPQSGFDSEKADEKEEVKPFENHYRFELPEEEEEATKPRDQEEGVKSSLKKSKSKPEGFFKKKTFFPKVYEHHYHYDRPEKNIKADEEDETSKVEKNEKDPKDPKMVKKSFAYYRKDNPKEDPNDQQYAEEYAHGNYRSFSTDYDSERDGPKKSN